MRATYYWKRLYHRHGSPAYMAVGHPVWQKYKLWVDQWVGELRV